MYEDYLTNILADYLEKQAMLEEIQNYLPQENLEKQAMLEGVQRYLLQRELEKQAMLEEIQKYLLYKELEKQASEKLILEELAKKNLLEKTAGIPPAVKKYGLPVGAGLGALGLGLYSLLGGEETPPPPPPELEQNLEHGGDIKSLLTALALLGGLGAAGYGAYRMFSD